MNDPKTSNHIYDDEHIYRKSTWYRVKFLVDSKDKEGNPKVKTMGLALPNFMDAYGWVRWRTQFYIEPGEELKKVWIEVKMDVVPDLKDGIIGGPYQGVEGMGAVSWTTSSDGSDGYLLKTEDLKDIVAGGLCVSVTVFDESTYHSAE